MLKAFIGMVTDYEYGLALLIMECKAVIDR